MSVCQAEEEGGKGEAGGIGKHTCGARPPPPLLPRRLLSGRCADESDGGVAGFGEARRTSYPAHFTILSQTALIFPISWMVANGADAGACPTCAQVCVCV